MTYNGLQRAFVENKRRVTDSASFVNSDKALSYLRHNMHKSGVDKWLVSEVTAIYIDATTVAKPLSSGPRSEGVRDAVGPIGSSSPLAKRPQKGKEKYLYRAFLAKVVHSKRSGMDHTVLPANNTMPAFPS